MTTQTETEAVTQAVLDYFQGWFAGDVERLGRVLHPDMVKRRAGEELGITTRERMLELAAQGEGAEDEKDGRVEVTVGDVYKDIATATVHSATYREYLHLVRTQTGWRIANALWELT
jgi:ketosteroid isomerase-like protein